MVIVCFILYFFVVVFYFWHNCLEHGCSFVIKRSAQSFCSTSALEGFDDLATITAAAANLAKLYQIAHNFLATF